MPRGKEVGYGEGVSLPTGQGAGERVVSLRQKIFEFWCLQKALFWCMPACYYKLKRLLHGIKHVQGAYNSGKPGKHGNLREFVNSGKLREFQIYSGNLYDTISWASSYVHNCQ